MNIRSKNIALLFSCVLLSISCVDKYLPDSLDAFDRDVKTISSSTRKKYFDVRQLFIG